MKRILRTIVIATLLLALFAGSAFAVSYQYVSNPDPTDRLNLRAAPRADAVSLGKYYNGTPVTVLGQPQNGYVRVRIEPLDGYMDAAYLSSSPVQSALPSLRVSNASGTGVNIRKQPNASSAIVQFMANGEYLPVLAVRDDGWLHVSYEGMNGFARADLLTPSLSYHKNESAQTSSAANAFVVNPNPSDRLNLRAAPSTEAAVLAKYYSGTPVRIIGKESGGWVKVRIGGAVAGYVQAKYLDRSGPVQNAMIVKTIRNSGGSGLHLRQSPDKNAASLGLYRNGTRVQVMGVWGSGWCHVEVDGKTGFMLSDGFESNYGVTFDPPGAEN